MEERLQDNTVEYIEPDFENDEVVEEDAVADTTDDSSSDVSEVEEAAVEEEPAEASADGKSTVTGETSAYNALAANTITASDKDSDEEAPPYIKCDSLVRIFKSEGIEVMALQGLDLEVKKGELMAIIGKSGSGKSTLLNLLGCLDKPSAGYVAYDGVNISDFTDKQLAEFRNKHIGFVWQKNADNLLNYLTVVQNVEMPLLFSKLSKKEKRERSMRLLEAVGLADKADRFPTMLSGGEQQRVAIATALVNEPELLLMDEPTGAVDKKTSIMLQDLFREINKTIGVTIIIVTHDISLADRVDRVVMISDGKISSERVLKEEYRKRIDAGEAAFQDIIDKTSNEQEAHEEYSILDKAGRVRLSAELREAVGIDSNRVKVEVIDGKVVISSVDK